MAKKKNATTKKKQQEEQKENQFRSKGTKTEYESKYGYVSDPFQSKGNKTQYENLYRNRQEQKRQELESNAISARQNLKNTLREMLRERRGEEA